jgi:hypothetical protein
MPLLTPKEQEFAILPFLAWLADPTQSLQALIAAIEELDPAVKFTWDFSDTRPAMERLKPKDRDRAEALIAFFEGRLSWAEARGRLDG